MTPKAQRIFKKMINYTTSILKTVCVSDGTIKKVKRLFADWEKIFANYISDKGLVSRILK